MPSPVATDRAAVPADFLLSGAFLVATAILLVNDFVLKRLAPGPIAWVLSDLAGMVFFPIAAVAVIEVAAYVAARRMARPWWFVAASVAVAAAFVLAKFTEPGQTVFAALLGALRVDGGVLVGGTGFVADPRDLVALALVPIPIAVGRRWRGQAHGTAT